MLYQTCRNPSLFSHSQSLHLSATTSSSTFPSLSSLFQEMEHVETALKSSTWKEMAMKLTPPALFDDLVAVGAQIDVPSDDFSVDDLLDFPNDDVFFDEQLDKEEDQQLQLEGASASMDEPQNDENSIHRSNDISAADEFCAIPTSELAVPADDLADLEWLSQFVDDSCSGYSSQYLTVTTTAKPAWLVGYRRQPAKPVDEESCFKAPVPAKARSKRTRTGGRIWSLRSSLTDSSSSSTSTSSYSTPSSPWLAAGSELLEPVEKSSVKKEKRKKRAESVAGKQQLQPQPRRCSHCGVHKTPQWRAGPMGAKTLCNACGVRYKSGRLVPEYRPACSPTFSSELHSNHHRKIMEMRRKKENLGDDEQELNHPAQAGLALPSF